MENKLRPFDFGDWLTIIVVVFLFVFAMLTSGCGNVESPKQRDGLPNAYWTEFTYEGCEYLKGSLGHQGYMAHKGNCSNPIHCTCDTLR